MQKSCDILIIGQYQVGKSTLIKILQDEVNFNLVECNFKSFYEYDNFDCFKKIILVESIRNSIDSNKKKNLNDIFEKIGLVNMNKLIVVLNHANDNPPDEYYESENIEFFSLRAWNLYIHKKKIIWNNLLNNFLLKDKNFTLYDIKYNMPVIFVELSKKNKNYLLHNNYNFLIDLKYEIYRPELGHNKKKCSVKKIFKNIFGYFFNKN